MEVLRKNCEESGITLFGLNINSDMQE